MTLQTSPTVVSIIYANADHYPSVINGTRLLAESGFRVSLFMPDRSLGLAPDYRPEVTVNRIAIGNVGSRQEYLRFIRGVLHAAPRDSVAFFGHDMHGFVPARVLATYRRRPLIYHCHDFTDRKAQLSSGGRAVRAFEQAFARTADLVVVPDEARGRLIESELRLQTSPEIAANSPLAKVKSRSSVLQTALLKHGRTYARIVYRHGSIGPGHALEATIRSMPTWASDDWGLVLIGWGDTSFIEHLFDLARNLGVANRLFLLPPVPYDDVGLYASGADLGHALYERDFDLNKRYIATASCKFMDYMAAGIPSLVSNTPEAQRLVASNQIGVTADERSPESIARAVNDVLGHPDRAAEMGRAATHAFDRQYSYRRQFQSILERLRNIL